MEFDDDILPKKRKRLKIEAVYAFLSGLSSAVSVIGFILGLYRVPQITATTETVLAPIIIGTTIATTVTSLILPSQTSAVSGTTVHAGITSYTTSHVSSYTSTSINISTTSIYLVGPPNYQFTGLAIVTAGVAVVFAFLFLWYSRRKTKSTSEQEIEQ